MNPEPTPVRLPAVGIGTAAFGRLYSPVSARTAAETIERAVRSGIRYVDTAPGYGDGLSEHRIGGYLAGRTGSAPLVLSTKVGTLVDELPDVDLDDPDSLSMRPGRVHRGWSVREIRESVEASLRRLRTTFVDVALLHDPETHEDLAATTGYQGLRELRAEGVVGAIGVGCNHVDLALRLVERLELDYVLLAGRYTLLDQSALGELLPRALDRGTRIIAAGVFNSGILATGDPDGFYNYRKAPADIVDRVRRLAEVCHDHDVELRSAAAQFASGHPAVGTTVVGVRSPDEVTAMVEALSRPIPPDFWTALTARGLLPEDAPVPLHPPLAATTRPRDERQPDDHGLPPHGLRP
ncbi:aldo/keto reductase [Micromonospora cathayae]|uniref:Aldo/keto reductase n=1 Tax=Micromonospora cathayae TaxID=3028804 RepID=A0ABY7ZXE2_9ACTN|nr:aldo/keto reductase [Micromonospora sp. HUAS 3]WDZ87757.1 aldo/keto reductase [Micromonospora sp. HUAS 3]